MADDIVTRLRCIYADDGCDQCTFCLAKAEVERLRALLGHACKNLTACEVENDEMNEDIIRLLTEVGRLRAAGDGLVAVISNCECVASERCGWCIAKDKWEEARRDLRLVL